MDKELKMNSRLLDLALHRYDEEERRNKLIDNKNATYVAFLGVMLTIQSTILPYVSKLFPHISTPILNFYSLPLSFYLFIGMLVSFILSLVFYGVALLYFISTLKYVDRFQAAPKISSLIDFGINNIDEKFIIQNTIVSLNKCVEDNDELLKEKTKKGYNGFKYLKLGIICTILFIFLFLIISVGGKLFPLWNYIL